MNILALDASTDYCSVAIYRGGVVDALGELAGRRHSELLLPMADELLGRHGLTVKRLDGIAFGHGPGSFTGLRIACGVAQGLALGAGLPVVGVSTLLALAQVVGAGHAVCCLDARMGEIYHAAYAREADGWRTVREASVCVPDAAPLLPPAAWAGCGSGFAAHGEALRRRYAGRLADVDAGAVPHAREIAQLSVREFELGRTVPAARAVPVYLRDRVALRSDER
jgi:tRNA threonylcarbamoyladenosine biosynthesis protein TsaB